MGDVFESLAVGARSCLQGWRAGVVGEVRQAGGQESVMYAGEEVGGVQAVVGNAVAVSVGDAGASNFERPTLKAAKPTGKVVPLQRKAQ